MRPLSAIRTGSPRQWATMALCIGTLFLLGGNRPHVTKGELAPAVIGARSFVITDPDTLAPFTFERVVESLASGQAGIWLKTLAAVQTGGTRRQVMMPLARFIALPETGYWRPAGTDGWSQLRLIAIVNRFDLADPDYAHCGEYRLIFSRTTEGTRLHIAIETVLPNPHPERNRTGCADVAAFWWNQARTESDEARRQRLERFLFDGLPHFRPVLDRHSFEMSGRIRTSEIGHGRPRFRQFELRHVCTSACAPTLTSVPLDNMPNGALFDEARPASERDEAFRREFLRHVASLSIPNVNRYFMNVDRAYSVSDVEALVPVFNYRLPFRRSLRTGSGREFRERITEELQKAGSALTPEDIIDRAETMNCAGCHGKPGPVGGGVVFPNAFESGEHIADESMIESAHLSPALNDVFLPYRIELLMNYMRTTTSTTDPWH